MKVYLEGFDQSRAVQRVYDALVKYKPGFVDFTPERYKSEFIIMHILGRFNQTLERVEKYLEWGKKVILIQYSVRRTLAPSTESWIKMWEKAHLVWSYYDLKQYCIEDKVEPDFHFYNSPLGSEPEVFHQYENVPRTFIIATSGLSYMTESVRECLTAANGKPVFHVGPYLGDDRAVYSDGMPDDMLARKYSACRFVSGLRRTEGFELPALEGLLCGAKPIFFDQPAYLKWFGDLGIFVDDHLKRDELIDVLKMIFDYGPVPVSDEDLATAKDRFNWKRIFDGFWNEVLA